MEKENHLFTRMEILKMARDIVNNEYVDLRGKLHNQWMVNSERVWLIEKRKLEYPTFPSYPTEEDIVRRARVLLNFLNEPVPEVMCGNEHKHELITKNHVCADEHIDPDWGENTPNTAISVSEVKPSINTYSIQETVEKTEQKPNTIIGRYLSWTQKK